MAGDPIVEINKALCEALGLQARDIKAITVKIAGQTLPAVSVEYSWRWTQEHVPHLSRVVGEFQLTAKPEDG